ncbi:hypothetical protein [Streptomyces tubercidicus]|uniref:hypothetical protein n=1 Tax=Streptomyces tubercidicus TaxID=47759 RepID=UPI003466446F
MSAAIDRLKGRGFRILAGALAVLVVAAGTLYFTGTYDRWQDGRALSRACDGIVPQKELHELLGVDGRLTSDQAWKSSARDGRKCVIYPPDEPEHVNHAFLVVTLGQDRDSQQLLDDLERRTTDISAQSVSPIGSGWRGVLSTVAVTEPRATVVMPCGGGARNDLVVNLQASPRNPGRYAPEQRTRLARIATQTAANAAEQAGCKTSPGKKIGHVPGAVIDTEAAGSSATAAGKATGTCAGIDAPTRETAADRLAPIEDCLVLDKKGEPAFRLAAYYGPFVQNGRVGTSRHFFFTKPSGDLDGVLYWTTLACPKQGGSAFYTAETVRSDGSLTKPDPAQRSALARFAERSAGAHGCNPVPGHTSTP